MEMFLIYCDRSSATERGENLMTQLPRRTTPGYPLDKCQVTRLGGQLIPLAKRRPYRYGVR